MEKTMAIIFTVAVTMMGAVAVLAMFTLQVNDADQATVDQANRGCDYQKEYSTDNSQIADRCLHTLPDEERNSLWLERAGIPIID